MIKNNLRSLLFVFGLMMNLSILAQPNQDQLGAWYMYFWNTTIGQGPWGLQGDVQHRNWNIVGDLEQLMLRGGLTYSPKEYKTKWTLGYANIQTGDFGISTSRINEHRIYQELLYPARIGKRLYTAHRFRYEQRWVEQNEMLTRYRIMVFLNIPINNTFNVLESPLYPNDYRVVNSNLYLTNKYRNETFDLVLTIDNIYQYVYRITEPEGANDILLTKPANYKYIIDETEAEANRITFKNIFKHE